LDIHIKAYMLTHLVQTLTHISNTVNKSVHASNRPGYVRNGFGLTESKLRWRLFVCVSHLINPPVRNTPSWWYIIKKLYVISFSFFFLPLRRKA